MASLPSVLYEGTPVLDLDYAEDSTAQADANFVLTASGKIIEVQGTAEGLPFAEEEFHELFRLAKAGIADLSVMQIEALKRG